MNCTWVKNKQIGWGWTAELFESYLAERDLKCGNSERELEGDDGSQELFMMEMLVLCHCKCGIVFVITKRQKWKVEVKLQNH